MAVNSVIFKRPTYPIDSAAKILQGFMDVQDNASVVDLARLKRLFTDRLSGLKIPNVQFWGDSGGDGGVSGNIFINMVISALRVVQKIDRSVLAIQEDGVVDRCFENLLSSAIDGGGEALNLYSGGLNASGMMLPALSMVSIADPLGKKGVGVDLASSNFKGAILNQAVFANISMPDSDFSSSNLSRAILISARCDRSNFRDAKMCDMNAAGARFAGSDFNNADLTDCDLSGADCRKCDFTGTVFMKTRVTDADFRGAKLSRDQLKYVISNYGKVSFFQKLRSYFGMGS